MKLPKLPLNVFSPKSHSLYIKDLKQLLNICDSQLEEFKPWEEIRDQFGLEEAKVVNFNRLIERQWKYKHGNWIGLFSNNSDKPILIYVIQVSN
jgi:hypothetical protein